MKATLSRTAGVRVAAAEAVVPKISLRDAIRKVTVGVSAVTAIRKASDLAAKDPAQAIQSSGLAASQWWVGWMTSPLGCVQMPGELVRLV